MDWKSILGSVAPTIATALGGPLAGAAVKFIGGQFLGDENASEEDIAKFVTGASPEQLVLIKKADNDFKLRMKELDVDVFKIEADDKKNSRAEHKDSIMPAVLSIMLTIAVALIIFALFYVEPPGGAKEPLLLILGYAIREWAGSMQYWFGTTKSSSDKTKMMK